MSFTKSATIGRVGEDLVRMLMDQGGIETALNDSTSIDTLKKNDIRCVLRGVEFAIEVKHDVMQAKSGNLAIEFHNPRTGNDSGIMVTEADLWGIVLQSPVSVWICRTSDLLAYFHEQKPVRDVLWAGDGNANLRLFNSHKLLSSICVRLDTLAPWEIEGVISSLLQDKPNAKSTMGNAVQDRVQRKRAAVDNRNTAS